MTRTQVLQEIRRMRFEEACGGWQSHRLTQEEAARLLGVCDRTFRRRVDRYEDEGLDGLADKRLGQVSARRAPVDEVVRTETLYRERCERTPRVGGTASAAGPAPGPAALPAGQADFNRSPIGSLRIRLPVASWIAFTSAGAYGGTPGSPTPQGRRCTKSSTMWTRTSSGASFMRVTG